MIGQSVQYILYGAVALVPLLGIAGLFLLHQVRRGHLGHDAMKLPLVGLALIASMGPYVGLFGTVWHIIQALGGIGSGDLNVAAIAQPIGEALYATLWGLGCAIPALMIHRVLIAILPEEDATSAPTTQAATNAE